MESSPSLEQRDHWWYRLRATFLRIVFEQDIIGHRRWLDVGSADGPSVTWVPASGQRVSVDLDPSALRNGGVAADARRLPFGDDAFDVVSAFDVIEHVDDDVAVLREFARVAVPGGRLCISVPAYEWAWSSFDVAQGHYRRYTARKLRDVVVQAGLEPERTTYAFAGVFPFFATARLAKRLRNGPPSSALPAGSRWISWVMWMLSALDRTLLPRFDLPFGSSIFMRVRVPEGEQ